ALAGALAGLVLDVLGLHGKRAAALALAGVLARAAVVARRAAAHALALVLALAVVLGRGRRAAALALARVLAVRTLALTSVVALTNVGFGLGGLGLLGVLTERLAASEQAGRNRGHHLGELL